MQNETKINTSKNIIHKKSRVLTYVNKNDVELRVKGNLVTIFQGSRRI